ncbi:MAG TPA: 4-alpha-glucanotransferase [Burkholderiaceae bacterium]|nr:4-alpha-glucanotransferase [Burkholderiaceae bacterium]
MRLPRSSGVLLHPTSLPGPFGSGDLGEAAYHFVDWLAAAVQGCWQVLPLGPTGMGNSPYMSPSAFAGNPMLIDLAELRQRGWLADEDLRATPSWNEGRIDFATVVPWRWERLRAAARRFERDAGSADRADFESFCARHESWLDDFTLFAALSDAHPGRAWCDWEPALVRREREAIARAREQHAGSIAFHRFCQWRFFDQWSRLREHAQRRGVRIIGDMPIYVAFHSAEVWARAELFELDDTRWPQVVAGVPPDYFSATGQRWGNPLYRWQAHADQGYAWWIERVNRTFDLVDVVRIDHFRGFASYWEIPADEPTAIHGRWREGPGAGLFDAIARAHGPLPIIAEDLGIVTPDVVQLRKRFAFPGMRILQFAFGEDARNPYLPHHHEPDSVVYTGTHDNDTTRGWWSQAGERQREHARDYLGTTGAEIHWDFIRSALMSVADTAIVPLQDVLGLGSEHRMNLPGIGEGQWAWRFAWSQVRSEHADGLAMLTKLYGRDGTQV